jgi:alkanesulfonate monooxygenase SsuD/methylene tetrahydromethanopterin reductase-like flavin-dependent oxidoreductase (luciferase family)
VGTPEAIAATVEEFAALGVEEVILSFGMLPFQVADASAVELFASEVFPLAAKGRPTRPIGD